MKNKLRNKFPFRVISSISRAMILLLAVWIFAFITAGFSEDFQNRPSAAEMDEMVARGTQCARGVNERCWATQYSTNPVQYQVEPFANSTEFYLDQSLMGAMASKIKSLILCYADQDTVYDGTTSISMYTVLGLFAELDIGNQADKFTDTPAIGGNPATYGDNPWRIYDENLEERYKAINSLAFTVSVVSNVMLGAYWGHGVGETLQEAYDAAVSDYEWHEYPANESSGYARQHCKIAKWENFSYQGGSGQTNESGSPAGGTETHTVHHDGGWLYDDLQVISAMPGENYITVVSTGIAGIYNHVYTTNVNVSGNIYPDITGVYIEMTGWGGGVRRWFIAGTFHEVYLNPPKAILRHEDDEFGWENTSGVEGDYEIVNTNFSGTPHAVFDIIDTVTTNAIPVDYSGDYYPASNNTVGVYWHGSAGYIFVTNGAYVIYSSLTLNTNEAYLTSGSLLGSYSAVNFITTSSVASSMGEYVPDCAGTYDEGEDTWVNGGWICSGNEESGWTISSNSPPSSPMWSKSGGATAAGTYVGNGTGAYGSVQATIYSVYSADWDTEEPTYYTHSAVVDGVVTTYFYECWLRKEAPSQSWSIAATNVEHRGRFFVRPDKPSYGGENVWNAEGLGLSEDVWNANAVEDWTAWSFGSPVVIEDYWTSDLEEPPDITSGPAEANTTICSGFQIIEWKGLTDWNFQYCPDE